MIKALGGLEEDLIRHYERVDLHRNYDIIRILATSSCQIG
jgi:hypothetical protein